MIGEEFFKLTRFPKRRSFGSVMTVLGNLGFRAVSTHIIPMLVSSLVVEELVLTMIRVVYLGRS